MESLFHLLVKAAPSYEDMPTNLKEQENIQYDVIFYFQIAFGVFLAMYTYICLVRTPVQPSWPELYVTACMISFGCEKFRTFLITESADFFTKFKVWMCDTKWHLFDSIAIVIFLFAFGLRFEKAMIPYTHAIYSTDICYWYKNKFCLINRCLY